MVLAMAAGTAATVLHPSGAGAALQYWDINGATAGAGGPSPGGIWNLGVDNSNWSSSSAGTAATTIWSNSNTAVFSAGGDATGAFTVLMGGGVSTGGLVFEEGTVTINGSLNFAGSTLDVAPGLTANLQSTISGSTG